MAISLQCVFHSIRLRLRLTRIGCRETINFFYQFFLSLLVGYGLFLFPIAAIISYCCSWYRKRWRQFPSLIAVSLLKMYRLSHTLFGSPRKNQQISELAEGKAVFVAKGYTDTCGCVDEDVGRLRLQPYRRLPRNM